MDERRWNRDKAASALSEPIADEVIRFYFMSRGQRPLGGNRLTLSQEIEHHQKIFAINPENYGNSLR